ncbi:MAG: hypothetical protein K0S08_2151 [Gammaproteobacteria bacterium]|jgi:hypothetical protein|nr:hypothetical protein [Gammaproteobacteria bacterium]
MMKILFASLLGVTLTANAEVTAWNTTQENLTVKYLECNKDGQACDHKEAPITSGELYKFQASSPDSYLVRIYEVDNKEEKVSTNYGEMCQGFIPKAEDVRDTALELQMLPDKMVACIPAAGKF